MVPFANNKQSYKKTSWPIFTTPVGYCIMIFLISFNLMLLMTVVNSEYFESDDEKSTLSRIGTPSKMMPRSGKTRPNNF
jgi:hypothetical protein